MRYIKDTLDFEIEENSVITLGKFDGLHRGHELLMSVMFDKARELNLKTVVFTFNIPPRKSVKAEEARVITTNMEKSLIFESTGLDYLIECPFVPEVRNLEPEEFIKWMVEACKVKCFVVGTDFCFGHNRAGNYEVLQKFAKKYDYQVVVLDKIQDDGRDISSTYIRDEIEKGNMVKADFLLGYPYFIQGEIVHGNQLGRTIGIPTINIYMPEEKVVPKFGVYVSKVKINNKEYPAVTNVGRKPTIEGDNPTALETHIIGFEGDVYGENAIIELLEFVRPEMKFNSVEELKNQMNQDVQVAIERNK